MPEHRFTDYSVSELRACGEAFKAEFNCDRFEDTRAWTDHVKQFFAKTASEGVSVLGCNGRPELMLDQVHISYPRRENGEGGLTYWDRILTKPVRIHLALESEWGSAKSMEQSLVCVLDDAQKLALVRADAKVILFATRLGQDRGAFVTRIEKVRVAMRDDRPWLWIDVPWDLCATRPPVYDVIAS